MNSKETPIMIILLNSTNMYIAYEKERHIGPTKELMMRNLLFIEDSYKTLL